MSIEISDDEAVTTINKVIKLVYARWDNGHIDAMQRDILINQLKNTLSALTGRDDDKYY
jgi:hypothetical protein